MSMVMEGLGGWRREMDRKISEKIRETYVNSKMMKIPGEE